MNGQKSRSGGGVRLGFEGGGEIAESETEDQDWINNWKTFFHPFTVDDILIKPSYVDFSYSLEPVSLTISLFCIVKSIFSKTFIFPS